MRLATPAPLRLERFSPRARVGGIRLSSAGHSRLERWFAAAGEPVHLDLARSGAPARSVRDVLDLADSADVEQYLSMSLDYGAGPGSYRLRLAVAEVTAFSPEDVVVTSGAVEALLLACAAVVGYRRLIAIGVPAYEGLTRAVEAAGGIPHPVPVWKPGSTRLDLSEICDLDLSRFAAVIVNSPHNPTGLVIENPELRDLAARCCRTGTALIVDEVSSGTLNAREPPIGAADRRTAIDSECLLVVGDVSKAYGLGGLRVGWCVTRSDCLKSRVVELRDITTLANSAPSQHLAALAIEHRDHLLFRDSAIANRDRLGEYVADIPGANWVAPEDGLVAFPLLPLPCSSRRFAELLLATREVAVTPGDFFGHDDHLRIGLGLQTDALEEGLVRLAEAISEGSR